MSIYARALYTIIDGTIYFDKEKDEQKQKWVEAERTGWLKKMIGEKKSGSPVKPAEPSYEVMHSCSDHYHNHGLLVIDEIEE